MYPVLGAITTMETSVPRSRSVELSMQHRARHVNLLIYLALVYGTHNCNELCPTKSAATVPEHPTSILFTTRFIDSILGSFKITAIRTYFYLSV